MNDKLRDLLPDTISDEAAYNLCEFFNQLSYALDSIYYAQARRHVKNSAPHRQIDIEYEDPPF